VVKASLGIKRTCPSCAARFYDLVKSPAECPKCGNKFDPEVLLKPRRPRPEPVRVVPEEPEEAEAEVEEEAEEVEAEAEIVLVEEPALDTEEEAEVETGAPARKPKTPLEQDGLVVVEDDAEDDTEEEDEIAIEEIEEEGDVAGILDTEIDKEEP
jgi:uncharacterized protein (TIGR02300 family)